MEGGGTNHRSYQVQPAFFLLSLGGGKGDKVYIFAIKYLPGFRYYKYSVVEGGENEGTVTPILTTPPRQASVCQFKVSCHMKLTTTGVL